MKQRGIGIQLVVALFASCLALEISRVVGFMVAGDAGFYWAAWVSGPVILLLIIMVGDQLMGMSWTPFRNSEGNGDAN